MNNKHTRVIGDRPGDRLDKSWKLFIETVGVLGGVSHVTLDNMLLKAMESHAYAITSSVFGHRRPDVVNEALMRAWGSLEKFQGRSRFSTWFHRIVLNVCKAHGARETREKEKFVSLSTKEVLDLYCEFSQSSTDTAFRKAWNVLTPGERDFMDDMLHSLRDAEVAAKWGLSLSGVRGRWHRIKRKIQAALG